MTLENQIRVSAIQAIMLAVCNQPRTFITKVYGTGHEKGYLISKTYLAINDFPRWWG
jgi:hypothetical protein